MARNRYPLIVDGTGASTGDSGIVRFMQYSTSAIEAGGSGVLYTAGTKDVFRPVKIQVEAGQAISSAEANKSLIYFDHAFEMSAVTPTQATAADDLPSGVGSSIPAGLSVTADTDGADTDTGYTQLTGTVGGGVTAGTYKFRFYVDQNGWSRHYIDYEVEVWPANTTPTQANASYLVNKIIQNQSAAQYLTDTITGSQIQSYTLKNISGFPAGVTPKVDPSDGRVYVDNVGATGEVAAANHTVTVEVDLGQYGKIDYAYTGNIGYGNPYGARYFGPANANFNAATGQDKSSTQATTDNACNPAKGSGALRRVHNVQQDTSPYFYSDGYGCMEVSGAAASYTNQTYYDQMGQYSKYGIMGFNTNGANWWSSGNNHQAVRFRWTVPNGVTSFCVVAVGGGSGGSYNWAAQGGGGGGLVWMNGITCTAGQVYYIHVGLGRQSESSDSSYGAGNSILFDPSGNAIVFAQGGGWTGYGQSSPSGQNNSHFYNQPVNGINYWNKGNGYNNNNNQDGGGYGVNTNYGASVNGFHYGGGAAIYASSRVGGGAGGYRGNAGNSGSSQSGEYGGGGSGYNYSSTYGQGAGGGVGLDGQGQRGGQTDNNPRSSSQAGSGYGGYQSNNNSYSTGSPNYRGGGGGGSGGSRGAYGENPWTGNAESSGNRTRSGGTHGGGGGGSGTNGGGGNGAPGGVRIIWGVGADGTARSFPYTYCSEKPTMKYNGES